MRERSTGKGYRRGGVVPLAGAALLLAGLAVSFLGLAAPSFAADTESFDVKVTAGENGTVNGRQGEFTETVAAGDDIVLELEADDGYVIGQVLVNGARLGDEDMEEIADEPFALLELEDIRSSLSVQVLFEEDEMGDEDEYDEETDPAGGQTQEGAGPEEPPEDEPEGTEPVGDPDRDEETIPEETEHEDEGAEHEGVLPAERAEEPEHEEEPEEQDGGADTADSAYADESPKTGDRSLALVILLMAASATLIGILCCGAAGRWRRGAGS